MVTIFIIYISYGQPNYIIFILLDLEEYFYLKMIGYN